MDGDRVLIIITVGVTKREIYAEFKNKQGIFAAMISSQAARLRQPLEKAVLGDRRQFATNLQRIAVSLLGLLSDPAVIAMFRLAISAAGDSPVIARVLEDNARAPNRKALTDLMGRAGKTGLLTGEAPVLAGHFVALVVGDLHVSLLLGLVPPPGPRELGGGDRGVPAAPRRSVIVLRNHRSWARCRHRIDAATAPHHSRLPSPSRSGTGVVSTGSRMKIRSQLRLPKRFAVLGRRGRAERHHPGKESPR